MTTRSSSHVKYVAFTVLQRLLLNGWHLSQFSEKLVDGNLVCFEHGGMYFQRVIRLVSEMMEYGFPHGVGFDG